MIGTAARSTGRAEAIEADVDQAGDRGARHVRETDPAVVAQESARSTGSPCFSEISDAISSVPHGEIGERQREEQANSMPRCVDVGRRSVPRSSRRERACRSRTSRAPPSPGCRCGSSSASTSDTSRRPPRRPPRSPPPPVRRRAAAGRRRSRRRPATSWRRECAPGRARSAPRTRRRPGPAAARAGRAAATFASAKAERRGARAAIVAHQ